MSRIRIEAAGKDISLVKYASMIAQDGKEQTEAEEEENEDN
jgi:hypothetical protein